MKRYKQAMKDDTGKFAGFATSKTINALKAKVRELKNAGYAPIGNPITFKNEMKEPEGSD